MNPIRIQLGKMPAMLARIVDDLVASESDMVVVGHASGTENPLHLARENGADMLITQDGQGGSPCLDVIPRGAGAEHLRHRPRRQERIRGQPHSPLGRA